MRRRRDAEEGEMLFGVCRIPNANWEILYCVKVNNEDKHVTILAVHSDPKSTTKGAITRRSPRRSSSTQNDVLEGTAYDAPIVVGRAGKAVGWGCVGRAFARQGSREVVFCNLNKGFLSFWRWLM